MTDDRISIIIPVYNAEQYLKKCIESVLNQTYKAFELILVDDGSADGSSEICDEYTQKDKRVTVIHKKNGGVSSARNAGLDAAKGTCIAFIDADDYIPENYFEALYHDMTDDVEMVRCSTEIYLPNGERHTNWPFALLKSTVVLESSDIRNFTECEYYFVWGVLFRRTLIEDMCFNVSYCIGEDTLFYFQALKRCNRIKHTISTAYCMVLIPGSATRSPFNEKNSQKYMHGGIYASYMRATQKSGK